MSSVGVVVVGENRYTGEEEKYVFEVAVNHDRLMGVLTDRAESGWERGGGVGIVGGEE